MDYFKDLQFIRAASLPQRLSYHTGRTFDNYYTLHYCHIGNFSLQINDGAEYTSGAHSAFLTYPGAKFAYGNPRDPYHHLYVSFRGELAEKWRAGGLLRCLEKDALINILNPNDFYSKFERLIAMLHSPARSRAHGRAVLLLAELLLQIAEQQQRQSSSSNTFVQKMNKLAKEIHRSPELEWDFRREAGNMKISYSYFRRVFEELHQEPPHHYLLQCRLQKAEDFLIFSELKINEIAISCGFPDEFYFSRLFKKYYGISPLNYRKEHFQQLDLAP